MIHNYKNIRDVLIKINKILQDKSPLIISGGSTIKKILKNYKDRIYNKKILLSDERLIKTTSKLRNDFFFKKLIQKKIMRTSQLINYKLDNYNKKEINKISKKIKKIKFKYALLSLGSNGHFASIFKVNNDPSDFYFINNSPKFPRNRVTVSLQKISKCKKIFFLAHRRIKRKEIKNFYNNKLIKKIKKKVELFTFQ
jgi:6-phosphogluconolactonase/glucosamine-6-phosphate isomerase/deaminase